MPVSPNNTLGRYRILREIARSNDIVYEAVDPTMNRRLAIKELQIPPHLSATQKRERIERFYREAKAAGTLSHPNIVTIYEVGHDGERHFIAMEYLEGQSLRNVLGMQGPMSLRDAADVTLGICDALSYAHGRGVVHRDIKPDNIHILPGGAVKLTDFGIARMIAEPSITSQGQVFGTPSYMSPEQIASHSVDHRTDIFSLGVTLYEMMAGRKPFAGDSVITITYNIMNTQPPMPPGLPSPLQTVLQRALAKNPAQRYQSASAMAADLRAERYGMEITPQPLTSDQNRTLQMAFAPPQSSAGAGAPGPYVPPDAVTPLPAAAPVQDNGYAASPMTPDMAAAQYLTPSARSNSSARTAMSLLVVLLLLAVLVGALGWGITAAYQAQQKRQRQNEAVRHYNAGVQATRQGDTTAAAREFAQAREIAPPQPEAPNQAAPSQPGTQPNAPTSVTPTNPPPLTPLDANNAAALNADGNAKWQNRDWQGALVAWEGAVQADPTGSAGNQARHSATQAYQGLGQQAAANGDMNQARQYWQKIIEVNPGSPEAAQAQQLINNSSGSNVGTAPPPGGGNSSSGL